MSESAHSNSEICYYGSEPFDEYANNPPAGTIVLVEGAANGPSERVTYDLVKGGSTLLVSLDFNKETRVKRFERNKHCPNPSEVDITTSLDKAAKLDTRYDIVIVEGIESVSEDPTAKLEKLSQKTAEAGAIIVVSIPSEVEFSHKTRTEKLADVIATITQQIKTDTVVHQFLIAKNRTGEIMESPRTIYFGESIDVDMSRDIA